MADDTGQTRTPLVVGVNHQTGGLSLRDRLFVEDEDVPAFLARLRDAGIEQAVVLSTCDRIEIVTVCDASEALGSKLAAALAQHGGMTVDEVAPHLYRHRGTDAVRHVFRVAASLDSVVVGEPQVLGQVKACHRLAHDAGMVSGDLEVLMQAAYAAAKRARTETAIGERPVSIAAVAAGISRDVHGSLDVVHGVLLGTGDMGELIARELMRAGLGRLTVADVGRRSARAVAGRLGAGHAPEGSLAAALANADVIVTAVGGRGYVLSADMIRAALKARRYRPQFIVDASVPRDVEPAVDRIDDAFLYDLADLERLAVEGQVSRKGEADAAEQIIVSESEAFLKGRRARVAVPVLTALRDHVGRLRQQALIEAGGDAELATHHLMNRLLHMPSERLREMAGSGEDVAAVEQMIRELFGIADDEDETP